MKKNILVFPCGSEIGLDIHRQIKYSTYFHLIGGSSVDDHGKYVYEDYIGGLPYMSDASFLATLQHVVRERKIDAIYPAMDMAISYLKKNEAFLGCKVIGANVETSEICLSKEDTYNILNGIIPIPQRYNFEQVHNYPVFVKPKIGYGSRGATIIHNRKELNTVDSISDKLILEYLPGEEYTVDCFTDKHGRLLFFSARKRDRIKMGISVNTTFATNQHEFQKYAEAINSKLRLRGAWFFQVKRNREGHLVLLEVAARFGGSSLLCFAIGVNFPLMTLFDAFDYEVSLQKNSYNAIIDRAFSCKYTIDITYNCVYVDFDDCLYLDNQRLNTELVAFLYRCINNNIRIILITKHRGDLNTLLKKLRIDTLFDKIIHLREDEEKYAHTTEAQAIFIDDSYTERQKIKIHRGIPVFSPEMVEVLS